MFQFCRYALGFAVFIGCLSRAAWTRAGTITTDGSLGRAQVTLSPSNQVFSITPSLGKQVGANLFFSFTQFSLDSNQIARFSGPASVGNILARVTGGIPSNIDGTLQNTIPGAAFYLINPAGVVFGPDAKLDMQGQFAVTTADQIKFTDQSVFGASGSNEASLTSAAPAAYGFLKSSPAGVVVNGATLAVPQGQALHLVAGNVTILGGMLSAPSGTLAIASVASPGDAPLTAGGASAISTALFPTLGAIKIAGNSTLDGDGPGGGRIVIRGGSLTLRNSLITAQNLGDAPGAGIDVRLRGPLMSLDGMMQTNTYGLQHSGNIRLVASDINASGELASTESNGQGRSGDILVQAASLELSNGATLLSNSTFTGSGGDVTVNVAGLIRLDGDGFDVTGIQAQTGNFDPGTLSYVPGGGAAGNIRVDAGSLAIRNGALIDAQTLGSGAGGNVVVHTAAAILLNGKASGMFTGISAETEASSFEGGRGGSIHIRCAALSVLNESEISATTSGTGAGGSVVIHSGHVTADAAGNPFTGITAESEMTDPGGGAGGSLTITANRLSMLEGAQLVTDTDGSGAGGNIQLNVARSLTLEGTLPAGATAISAQSNLSDLGSGNAGNVNLTAGSMSLLNGAQLDSGTSGSGSAGAINVTIGGALLVDGGPTHPTTGIFDQTNLTAPGGGAGGAIQVNASTISMFNHGGIDASTTGTGSGGSILLTTPGALLLANRDAGMGAESDMTEPGGGNGGNITLNVGSLSILHNANLNTSTKGTGIGGTLRVNASGAIVLDGQDANQTTGMGAQTQLETRGGGAGGDVILRGGSLLVTGGAGIDASTFGTGAGGNINIRLAGDLRVIGSAYNDSDIAVTTRSLSPDAGQGGTLRVRAQTAELFTGAGLEANTEGTGNGGIVVVHVLSALTLDGDGMLPFTNIAAQSSMTAPGGGNAGSVTVSAGSLAIRDLAGIDASTFGTGQGSSVTVNVAGLLQLDGNNLADGLFTGISANSTLPAAGGGDGGRVTVNAGNIQAVRGAQLSTQTQGSGLGGDVDVNADHIALDNARLLAASTGAGRAGNIVVSATGSARFADHANVAVSAPNADGGGISISAVQGINIVGATLSAAAGGDGGTIQLATPSIVLIRNSQLTAAAGGNGGNIVIDPALVVLDNSQLSANAIHGNGGNVTIAAGAFLRFETPIDVSSQFGVAGTVLTTSPDQDVAGSLVALRADLSNANLTLAPTCAARASDGSSSFIAVGAGGPPPAPEGWLPAASRTRR